jgi:WD40 repeat protein
MLLKLDLKPLELIPIQSMLSSTQATTAQGQEQHEVNALGQEGQVMSLGQGGQVMSLGQEGQVMSLGQGGQVMSLGQGGQVVSLGQEGQVKSLGHGGQVKSLTTPGAWSADMEWRNLYSMEGHTDAVRAVAITPDGSRVVSCSDDGTVMVWDMERMERVWIFEGHTDGVKTVAISPDGGGYRVVSGGDDHSLR